MTTYDAGRVGQISGVRAASATVAGIGVWLIIAPFVLQYSDLPAPTWNGIVCGAWLVLAGLIRAGSTRRNEWLSWTNLGFGLWLIVAPFILGYSGEVIQAVVTEPPPGPIAGDVDANVRGATWNDVVCGILVALLAAYSGSKTRQANNATPPTTV